MSAPIPSALATHAEECPCCFEPIHSSVAVLACSHRFHITCLVNWFATQSAQELPQNCPCCRTEAGEKERLPEAEDGEEDEDNESEYSDDEDEDAIWLTRSDLDGLLKNVLGGIGAPDALWFAFFDEGDEERNLAAHRLPFTQGEIGSYSVPQGGRQLTDEEWETLVERYPEPAEEPAAAAVEANPERVLMTRYEFEDEVVWPNGGIGIVAAVWETFSPGSFTHIFTRAEIDAYLARPDQMGARPLTDEQWAELLESHGYEEESEEEPEERGLTITWRRRPDGDWERIVLNPEQQEPAVWGVNSPEPPPEDLTEQLSSVATRFQLLWRSHKERQRQKQQEAAVKIQAIWRAAQQRGVYTAARVLANLH
jgi:hypothetical protein